jgi:hypothetical protein
MNILGLNAFHGDASAAVLRDGQLVAAIEEERLNRIKHWAGLPGRASGACLEGAQPHYIGISRNPKAHLRDKLARAELQPHHCLNVTSPAVNSMHIAQVAICSRQRGLCHLTYAQIFSRSETTEGKDHLETWKSCRRTGRPRSSHLREPISKSHPNGSSSSITGRTGPAHFSRYQPALITICGCM